MKKFSLFCLTALSLLLSASARAQAPLVQWTKGIGGMQNDYAYCIRETVEGNLIVAGSSNSGLDMPGAHAGYDVFVALLSSSGTPIWGKAYGGNNEDYGYAIRQTPDSGFIVAGATNSIDGDVSGGKGNFDMWVLKVSRDGNVQWQTTLGGSAADYAYDIQVTADSGFIVAGRSASSDGDLTANQGGFDTWIVKLTAAGAIEWQKSLGGNNDENAASVIQLKDGGYAVAGDTYSSDGDVTGSHGGEDYWIIRLSAAGSVIWKKCYGGTGSDYAQCIRQTPEGGFIITGGSNSANGDVGATIGGGDAWMLKLSGTGAIEWKRNAGSESADVGNSVEVMADSAYLVTGYVSAGNGDVTEFHGQGDYWLVKMSRTGDIEWEKCMGNLGNENATSGQQLSDGSFVVAGHSSIVYTDWPGVVGGKIGMYVVKLGLANAFDASPASESLSIFPNPASDKLYVRGINHFQVVVQDMMGKIVARGNDGEVSLTGVVAGVYVVSIFDKGDLLLKRERLLKL